jgi:Methylase involved in ubiquinone/menaquinone biosynthesis
MEYKNVNYDEYADKYSIYRNASPRAVSHILQKLNEKDIDRVLEIGSGTADHLYALAKGLRTINAYGFDKSEKMILEGNIKNPGLNLIVADALTTFPYTNDSFDFAYSINVIHYMTDLLHYFREAYRVLKNDGIILTVTTSTDEMKKYLQKYFSEFGRDETKSDVFFEKIKSAMESAGFINMNVTSTNYQYKLSESDLGYIENKTVAWSRLLSQECYENGLALMREDAKNDKCEASEYFLYFWGLK